MVFDPNATIDQADVIKAVSNRAMTSSELQAEFKTTHARIASLLQYMRRSNMIHSYKVDKKWVWATSTTPKMEDTPVPLAGKKEISNFLNKAMFNWINPSV
jgi:hypothetical protein